jgi:hypothetical protein
MRLSNGTTNLFVAASFLATTVSRSRAKELQDADTGILLSSTTASQSYLIGATSSFSRTPLARRSLQIPLITSDDPQCTAGFVDCVDGIVRGSVFTTCADACGPTGCCVGDYACDSFTGKVCIDGSCSGAFACTYAYIPSVVNSCMGDFACYATGYDGTVGNISNSCNAYDACCYMSEYGGTAGKIDFSCNEFKACESVAYKGSIGNLSFSCNATSACKGAGSPTNGTGMIPYDLLDCCNDGDSICIEANKDTLPTECWPDTEVRRRGKKRRCCCVMQSSYFSQLLHPCLSSSLLYHVVH